MTNFFAVTRKGRSAVQKLVAENLRAFYGQFDTRTFSSVQKLEIDYSFWFSVRETLNQEAYFTRKKH